MLTVSPNLLTRDLNQTVKQSASQLKQRISEGLPVPYWGERYWEIANPLLYYAERLLAQPQPTAQDALAAASKHPDGLLVVDRSHLDEFKALGRQADTVLEGPRWVLLAVP